MPRQRAAGRNPISECVLTSAEIVLSDFASNVNIFLKLAKDTNVLLRRNINPILIEQGPEQDLQMQIKAVSQLSADHKNVIIGTGVISYNTAVERVLMLKDMCLRLLNKGERDQETK